MRKASSAVTTRVAALWRPRYEAETSACPADRPLTIPVASTATTSGRVEDHAASKDTIGVAPDRSRATAMHGLFCPINNGTGQDISIARTSDPVTVASV